MRTPTDIAFAMTGPYGRNSRAIRQVSALAERGYRVTVFSLDREIPPLPEGVSMVQIPEPSGRGPRFFWEIHRAFSAALPWAAARLYHASDLYVLHAARAASTTRGGRLSYDSRESYPDVASTARSPLKSRFWKSIVPWT